MMQFLVSCRGYIINWTSRKTKNQKHHHETTHHICSACFPETFDNNLKTHSSRLAEVRCVEEETHKHTAESTCNRDRHDPCSDEQADTLPVDSLVSAVAETDTDGGTGDAHRGRNGEGELGKDEDGDRGAHFHAAAAGR